MSEEESLPKWEGKARAEIRPFTAAQVWPLVADDFCGLHKWVPDTIDTCHRVEGELGHPGLTRYVANSLTSKWAYEKLIEIDPHEMRFSYEVMDNTFGFRSYVAAIHVSPLIEGGCKIEWSFVSQPVEGMKLEDFRAKIESILHAMAENMDAALKSK